jgi:hypothetical protein
MHIGAMVNDVQKVLDNLSAEHGEFVLAMLHNSDSLSSTYYWHLIVSAPWTDEMGTFEAIRLIADALHDGMSIENQPAISRIRVLKSSDPLVRDMTFLYPEVPPGPAVPLSQIRAGDLTEGGAFIFHSRKPTAA